MSTLTVALIFITLFPIASGVKYVVTAPNTFRLGVNETVGISISHGRAVEVQIYLTVPGNKNVISLHNLTVETETPQIISLLLRPEDLPELQINQKPMVKLVVKATGGEFTKEAVLPVTTFSGYAFVQTDKPVYLPDQDVRVRILRLDESLKPVISTNEIFILNITNPNGTSVMYKKYTPDSTGIIDTTFQFPIIPVYGNWTVTVHYGYKLSAKSTVYFQVKEYVLPTFSVTIEGPTTIRKSIKIIVIGIEARYVYGKPVKGYANVAFKIRFPNGSIVPFVTYMNIKLFEGLASIKIPFEELSRKNLSFPKILGCVFITEATVIDDANGKSESAQDDSTIFATSPFEISVESSRGFIPGAPYEIQAKIFYQNHRKLNENVRVEISEAKAMKSNGEIQNLNSPRPQLTDIFHRVIFSIDTLQDFRRLIFTLKTKVYYLDDDEQATAKLNVEKYYSPVKDTYIHLISPQNVIMKVGSQFNASVKIRPYQSVKITHMVTSRGRILLMNDSSFTEEVIQFQVTADMVPSFRLVVFAIIGEHLISDSLHINVIKTCKYNNGKEVLLKLNPLSAEYAPKQNITLQVHGEIGSRIGLSAIDSAVYVLNKPDLISREKMFSEMALHDMGFGNGGGINPGDVFDRAGILILSHAKINPHGRKETRQQQHLRTKRNAKLREKHAASKQEMKFTGKDLSCCRIGIMEATQINATTKRFVNCSEKAKWLATNRHGGYNCSVAFNYCCQEIQDEMVVCENCGPTQNYFRDPLHSNIITEEIRQFFPETWFFETYQMWGKNCQRDKESSFCEINMTIPDSITTWMVEGVGVSQKTGMCVAEPVEVKVSQPMFIQLDIPRIAVKEEQIQIIATVYNYGKVDLNITLYVYGNDDLCLGADIGINSKIQKIKVKSNDAGYVVFPVMPLKVGELPLRVKAQSSSNQIDIIEKILKVVHGGITERKTKSFILDPYAIYTKEQTYKDDSLFVRYDKKQKLQKIEIDLHMPESYVPGSEKCVVSAIADVMGQAVNTTLSGLIDKFFLLPHGCGEQTMIKLAPLVYTMSYLENRGLLSAKIKTKGTDLMEKGYRQELTFRKIDGSFGIFPYVDSSTWLTAFVVKVFSQASDFIEINQNYVCNAISWLVNMQNISSGEFIEKRAVDDKKAMGGVENSLSMTAYVVIAMLKDEKCDSKEKKAAVKLAVIYLEKNDAKQPFTKAMVAYALRLANSTKAVDANRELRNIEHYDTNANTRHWNWDASEPKALPWVYRSNPTAAAVETTSYALLTQLLDNDMEYSNPIANWLNRQRSESGSFVSTQDTVMALEALAEYNRRAKIRSTNITCTIESDQIKEQQHIVLVQQNATILQEVEVPANGKLYINATGEGVGSMSVTLQYNVQKSPEKSPMFELSVLTEVIKEEMLSESTKEFKKYRLSPDDLSQDFYSPAVSEKFANEVVRRQEIVKLHICTKYLIKDTFSGMSILDIGLLTGYVADNYDLLNLKNKASTTKIYNFEINERSVKLYLDQVPNNETLCITLKTIKIKHVGRVQSTVVKIYKYYEPAYSASQFYGPDELIKPICEGERCKCFDALCSPCTPFEDLMRIQDDNVRTKRIIDRICTNSYIWNGKITSGKEDGNYFVYEYQLEEKIKTGNDIPDKITNERFHLEVSKTCPCPRMQKENNYIIMANDTYPIRDKNIGLRLKYKIDQDVLVYRLRPDNELSTTENKLFRDLNINKCRTSY